MNRIEIINPVGPHRSMSRQHAARYSRQGRGEFVGEKKFRFFDAHRLHRAAVQSSVESRKGYDGCNRMLSAREIQSIPVISPEKMLAPTGKLTPHGRNGRVRIIVAGGVSV